MKRKFLGPIQVARLFTTQLTTRPWICSTEGAPMLSDIMLRDQTSTNGCDVQTTRLRDEVHYLQDVTLTLRKEKRDLVHRIDHLLELCVCKAQCMYDGNIYVEGEQIYPDPCTVCECQGGRVTCRILTNRPECVDPCISNPCINGGHCHGKLGNKNVSCDCPPMYTGKHCEFRINCCVYPRTDGACVEEEMRWYFNIVNNQCEKVIYSGCGVSPNNFLTLSECEHTCRYGACCFRSKGLPKVTEPVKPYVECKPHTFDECQRLHLEEIEYEVLAFHPGATCNQEECNLLPVGFCIMGNITYPSGTKMILGCEECECIRDGSIRCGCTKLVVRKEMRDMTRDEIRRFQNALKLLRLSGPENIWEKFRDLYMSHIMHSHDILYFLPWHRVFVRYMEQQIQEIDCDVFIPYFDVSVDAGNFSNSILWQPNYFGGNGEGNQHCVVDHPFRGSPPDSWWPCLKRQFDTRVVIPNMIEISHALAGNSFLEFSESMMSLVVQIHSFVGGDLATAAAAYDPLFYTVHSYIDMLYWKWQKLHGNIGDNSYPLEYLDTPMVPFNLASHDVLHSEETMCVTYALPSEGKPCNGSFDHFFGPDGYDLNGYDMQGFDKYGYDRAGYDISGYNRSGHYDNRDLYHFDGFNWEGYNRAGYDRRGYNQYGYDQTGYNRECYDIYGYDCDGYDRYGFNKQRYDRYGIDHSRKTIEADIGDFYDEHGLDVYCLNFQGLSVDGYDRFGFDKERLDRNGCSCGYEGPFVLINARRLQDILHHQSREFLHTLPRSCSKQDNVMLTPWENQTWKKHSNKTIHFSSFKPVSPHQSVWSKMFCFDADMFLSHCPCQEQTVQPCDVTPDISECQNYREAKRVLTVCDSCTTRWHIDGQFVDCSEPQDYCIPNPCQNGGTCLSSRWPQHPHLVSCNCAPQFEGTYCEHPATQSCYLAVDPGHKNCHDDYQRWFFNKYTGKCEPFIYSGCYGNSNNFLSYYDCRVSCIIGACCYRMPLYPDRLYGYDAEGYDRYGYNINGFNREGKPHSFNDYVGGSQEIYDADGFDYQGYDQQGFDKDGYDHLGYNRRGYHKTTGFNMTGYNSFGDHDGIIAYNVKGFDKEGYNRAGFNCQGYSRDGWNYYGLSAGWKYECRAMSLYDCQKIETEYPYLKRQVVKFALGKKCEETQYQKHCGCMFLEHSYVLGEKFKMGCTSCECQLSGIIHCSCPHLLVRKEIRDLTIQELKRFQYAVKYLQTSTGFPSRWHYFTSLYHDYIAQAHGGPFFLPWHRFFLRLIEMELQKLDCEITIPYFDWTMDVGALDTSVVWQANYFGGNGNIDDGYCVTYHPFKDSLELHWIPCLQRNFNLSVQLPDAVNLQLILNEESYDTFRIKLESVSSLFHLFVGGQMASPYSAYDPIFLVHIAFMDKLWDNWQHQKKTPVIQFPPELRYVPMMPFDVTPDDVFVSHQQLCVTYVLPTEGTPCNTSSIVSDEQENRNFDLNGFDRNGYDRNGYDSMGWNLHGFSKDLFNRDGFDKNGYDFSGYNRYGFDRNGCKDSGFCIKVGIEVQPHRVPDGFDSNGYNRFGFNVFGYDRRGYDIYGFDSKGIDENHCSYGHEGPFYPRFKHWVEKQLPRVPIEKIPTIERICPQMSTVPEWWLELVWLVRDDQVDEIREFEVTVTLQHSVDTNYIGETSNGEWQPPMPDERFCFKLNFYTGCDMGTMPVLCTLDKCTNASCPGFPDAHCQPKGCEVCEAMFVDGSSEETVECLNQKCQDKNGTFREDGDVWYEDVCQKCRCEAGQVTCIHVTCPKNYTCLHPISKDEQCCPLCKGCMYEGQTYENNTKFNHPQDPCLTCVCTNGTVRCTRTICPLTNSCDPKDLVTPVGHCCPLCTTCGPHQHGSHWQEEHCKICTCKVGKVECEQMKCPSPLCSYPWTPPGGCCKECSGCLYEGSTYTDSERFRASCSECECKRGNVKCQRIKCPQLHCSQPTVRPGECCPTCVGDSCQYEGRTYKNGSFFSPNFNPCLNCSCKDMKVRCQPKTCPEKNLSCAHPVTLPGECCPVKCPSCIHKEQEHQHGEEWPSIESDCELCKCMEGVVTCYSQEPCQSECIHGYKPPKTCCSPCVDCVYESQVVQNGQTFTPPHDPCLKCTCKFGNIACSKLKNTCPLLSCQITEVPEGQCCPVCKGCEDEMRRHLEHGRRWIHPRDNCQVCTCLEGKIRCDRQKCNAHCSHPIKRSNRCCPDCSGCQFHGVVYHHGAEIKTENPCTKCYCYNGNVGCESVRCSNVSCSRPYIPANSCCPVCDDCLYDGSTYKDEEIFFPSSDPCLNCTCKKGSVKCENIENLCNPQCSHPAKAKGQCCRMCNDCEFKQRNYVNNQEFLSPDGDPCVICHCKDGYINCIKQDCPPVMCKNPVMIPGQCCPSCPTSCNVDGSPKREGDIWTDPGDKCKDCRCIHGQVQCQLRPCPEAPCPHPAAPYRECCPVCEHCQFTRRLYRNGQKFVHLGDFCQTCKCQNGAVTCVTTLCPPLKCSNPSVLPDQCCPLCPEVINCQHNGKTYNIQETFPDSKNSCRQCICLDDGNVICHLLPCPDDTCPNPFHGECCEQCNGCSYSGKNFRNQQDFTDPDDPCRKCHCQDGHVTCNHVQCPLVDCKSFVEVEDECCPVCQDCLYKNQRFSDGESFTDSTDPCLICQCKNQRVVCSRQICPKETCLHPLITKCCKECSDCFFENRKFSNKLSFQRPSDPCQTCICENGTVSCRSKICEELKCTHPFQGRCCRECGSDCKFRNQRYNNWQVFPDPFDPCLECQCKLGNVTCRDKPCPSVHCDHPLKRHCCKECEDCFYLNRAIFNGQTFRDPSNVCNQCTCKDGNIFCKKRPCQPVSCQHPVSNGCCLECNNGCLFEGNKYTDGVKFENPHNKCQQCLCFKGTVKCSAKPCPPVRCTNPEQGDCCPECHGACMYGNQQKENGTTFPHVTDSCKECLCLNEKVECHRKACPFVACQYPALGHCCPECYDCLFYEQRWSHGATFEDPQTSCSKCRCQAGNVSCEPERCPHLSCPLQFTPPNECCPVCEGPCVYEGVKYEDGEEFTSAQSCQKCLCVNGNVHCTKLECPDCPHPVINPSHCCPQCSDCIYQGKEYREGQRFLEYPCQECICKDGTVTCSSVACDTPDCINTVVPEGQCCPTCAGCVVNGVNYKNGDHFINPKNICEECTCVQSEIICSKSPCLHSCLHPKPYTCCPICDSCFFENTEYENGKHFAPDLCRNCICTNGNVHCVEEACPELNCVLRIKVPGQCCEVCRGCVYEGKQYENGVSWTSVTNPCMSCQCQGGVVTCGELHCIVPCENPVPVPGHCCPMCPDCEMNGKSYQNGETFTPNENPCETCSCEAGQLLCITQQCPSLLDCPLEAIRPPGEGQCCPTCAGFGTNCTLEHLGMVVHPSSDPCFTCTCKDDFNWLCLQETCERLQCPPQEIYHNKNECCPKCKVCLTDEGKTYQTGENWTSVLDPCSLCYCNYGDISCDFIKCSKVTCLDSETRLVPVGKCCEVCVPVQQMTCFYGGRTFQDLEKWNPDVCTECYCKMGNISCHTQRCLPLQCPSDHIPSVDPGHCCPKCIPRPATCVTFGDPHYRTFDGMMIHFQGTCRYIMASDCDEGNFRVEVQNSDRGIHGVSWTDSVTVIVKSITVNLGQGPVVSVNNKNVTLPFFQDPVLYIEYTGESVLVNTNVGLKVLWNGDSYAEVSVSGAYRGKVCGLCGNFNNFPQDDLRVPSGEVVTSEADFGNNWKSPGHQLSTCKDAFNIDPCSEGGYHSRRTAISKCSVLKDHLFAPCHRVIPPEPYFAACIYDLCACSENDNCLCDILSSYSQECSQAGVVLHWRSSGLCAISCPSESGQVFDECGPACPRTCTNKDVPFGVLEAQCFKPCVPGCQCLADKVLHNGHCIRPEECLKNNQSEIVNQLNF